jgi:hypothetical protein
VTSEPSSQDQPTQPLFRRSGQPTTEAVIGGYGYEDFLIANGFFAASRVLVKALVAGDGHAHELVYPIAFGYQQFTELSLKGLVRLLQSLVTFDDPAAIEHALNTSHNIDALLAIVVDGVGKVDLDLALCDDMQLLAARVDELHEFNPSAFAFRYTRDKNGKRYVTHATFDVPSFAGTMDEVGDLIYGLEGWLKDEKVRRLNAWADLADEIIQLRLCKDGKHGTDIYHMGGNVLQMQWTKRGSGRWVTCQLGSDKLIDALFWDEHDKNANSTQQFDPDKPEVAADEILAFLDVQQT